MKYRALKIFKILAVAVFMAGVVAAGLAYTVKRAQGEHPSVGFHMVSTQVFTPVGGGQPSLHATIERYQKADGSFKLVTTYNKPDGTVKRVDTGFGQTGRGVFQVDEKNRSLNFISPMRGAAPVLTEAMMRQDPNAVGDKTVSGYKTIVVRIPDSDGSGYTELYQAPALQGTVIKSVFVSEAGVTVIEPTKIVTGEPDAAVFEATPAYPVNYDQFEKKIKSLEEAGNLRPAEEMRRLLQQLKSAGQ